MWILTPRVLCLGGNNPTNKLLELNFQYDKRINKDSKLSTFQRKLCAGSPVHISQIHSTLVSAKTYKMWYS